jgi:hypothetical protein
LEALELSFKICGTVQLKKKLGFQWWHNTASLPQLASFDVSVGTRTWQTPIKGISESHRCREHEQTGIKSPPNSSRPRYHRSHADFNFGINHEENNIFDKHSF